MGDAGKIQTEYERVKGLFADCEEKQLALLDGAFWECARMRVELDDLQEALKATGHVAISKKNPVLQKELPVSKVAIKVRANYLNYIAKLSGILGKAVTEEDDGLAEFE